MTTATKDLVGQRVHAGDLFGQLTGWNQQTGRVWVLDEVSGTERVLEGVTPELALLTCVSCGKACNRLFPDAMDLESDAAVLCVEESRERAQKVSRTQSCDWCSGPFAYRNTVDRENLYLCSGCHVKRGKPIQQNKWMPRVSQPLNPENRAVCEKASHAQDCRGEIKWRGGLLKANLCNAHAGRVSAGDPYADRVL